MVMGPFESACVLCGEEAVQDCMNTVRFDVRTREFERNSWFGVGGFISRMRSLVLAGCIQGRFAVNLVFYPPQPSAPGLPVDPFRSFYIQYPPLVTEHCGD